LRDRLAAVAADLARPETATPLTRSRHRAALREALACLAELDGAELPELRAECLRAASAALGRITGRVGIEAVLDAVFREFCIGK
jgi:tRNA modification GTPase